MPVGKRDLLARALFWSGAASLLSLLPDRDSLLVLNYHRIGNPEEDPFDPGVFSATADQFDDQISYLKRRASLVTLEEALAFICSPSQESPRRCRVLITFDDGYLDNYSIAFPVLRSHGVQGVFFLVTTMVGSGQVPWWDHIAYLIKTAQRRKFSLRYPAEIAIDIEKDGVKKSLYALISLYKTPENSDPARFLRELQEAAAGADLPSTLRRFLNWEEAREMITGGMAIGSHTHCHHVLSQLDREQQSQELRESRSILRKQLGTEADVLAYPIGGKDCFSEETQMLARELGYRAAFSFYGGTNIRKKTHPYDVKRIAVARPDRRRFQVQTTVCRHTGSYWP